MARCFSVVLLLGFVVAGAASVAGGRCECEVSPLAAAVAASCAAGAATPPCCEPVLASVELGGAACLCRVASETLVLHAGLNGSALHADCGGAPSLAAGACHAMVPPPLAPWSRHCRPPSPAWIAWPRRCSSPWLLLLIASALGGPPSPLPSSLTGPERTIHLTSRHRKALIVFAICQAIELPLMLGIGVYKLYRRCYPKQY